MNPDSLPRGTLFVRTNERNYAAMRDSDEAAHPSAAPQGAQPAEQQALAGPLEQPQEPTSDQANLAQASGVCDLQTALPRWEPIDTAPKDATAVLVMRNLWPGCKGGVAEECNGHNTYVAEWWQGERGGHGAWVCYMDAVHDPRCPVEPTHWMPLPKPPEAA